jgi:hypothetical protein
MPFKSASNNGTYTAGTDGNNDRTMLPGNRGVGIAYEATLNRTKNTRNSAPPCIRVFASNYV